MGVAVSWWVYLLPASTLALLVGAGYLVAMAGLVVLVLKRGSLLAGWARSAAIAAAALTFMFGINLAAVEFGIGQSEEAIVMAEEVPVQSAPTDDRALQVFTVHEGTKVRIDQRSDEWVEIVLEDGKVGWVRLDVLEAI